MAKKGPTGRSLFSAYLSNCKRRNVYFGLSFEKFIELTSSPCLYCGRKPSQKRYDYTYNGLDRMDPKKGYYVGNVAPCCKECNGLKSDRLTVEEMKTVGAALATHRSRLKQS